MTCVSESYRSATFALVAIDVVAISIVVYMLKIRPWMNKMSLERNNSVRPRVSFNVSNSFKRSKDRDAPRVRRARDDREAWEIRFDELQLQKKIAAGSFGTIHLAKWLGQEVAVKTPSNEISEEALYKFMQEIRLMSCLHHPNVVVFLGACVAPNICLVMEYLPNGSLYDLLRKPEYLMLRTIVKFAIDICRGMLYLHRRANVIQRDLKSQNLLIDDFNNVKVCDFGLSRVASSVSAEEARGATNLEFDQSLTACGTPLWSAPEVIRNEAYNQKADVYSFSIVLCEMITKEKPYEECLKPPLEIAYHVAENGMRPTLPDNCPPDLRVLTEACWDDNPVKRPSMQRAMETLQGIQKDYRTSGVLNDLLIPTFNQAPPPEAPPG